MLDKYEIEERLLQNFKDSFKGYGYKPISVPIIEDYDTFSNVSSTVLKNEMFKFIGASGEILVLRPDVTIPIAKKVAKKYKHNEQKMKLFYISKVFRSSNLGENEFTQAGLECFGNEGLECDAEIVAVSVDTLAKNHMDIHIEIGHVGYYKGLLKEIQMEHPQKEALRKLIENKNFTEMKVLITKLDVQESIKEVLFEMPSLYGKFEEILPKAKKLCLNSHMERSVHDLEKFYKIIRDYGYGTNISIDLGLVNHLDYYTGIIYKGYIPNHGKIILSGGRYDQLAKNYDKSIPACGLAINVNELIKGAGKMECCKEVRSQTDYLILYKEDERKTAFTMGKDLRKIGYSVETEPLKSNLNNSILCAEQRGVKEIILLNQERAKLISIQNNTTKNINTNEFLNSTSLEKCKVLSIH